MKHLALLLVLAVTPAFADDCDALAARIVAETGMSFERRANQYVHFKGAPPIDTVSAHCAEPGLRRSFGIFSHDTALPPAVFFDTAAAVAEVFLGLPRARVRASALKCQRLALKDKDGDTEFDDRGFTMSCTVKQPGRDPRGRDAGFIGVSVFSPQ